MALIPGTHLGPYKILSHLGSGGMGVVYRARDERLDREVALKVLPAAQLADEAARRQLQQEARTASALNHPHICTIFEVGEAEGQVYVAMELIKGRLLKAIIPSDGLPAESLERYGAQIADALAHAHEHGIVHRDLKSANLMVTEEGRTKILDFGLAVIRPKDISEATRSLATLSAPDPLAGTLPYMAPEVLRGAAADSRSDLWALGVMLYEMACGALPFRGRTGFELTSAILRDPPDALSERVPSGIRSVIRRCLAKDPAQRYQRAGEVRAALEASVQHPGQAARASVVPARRLGRWFLATAAIAVLMAALWIWKSLRRAPAGGGAARTESVAVLPLQNLSGDPAQDYFSDGMTEALISDLAQIRALKVISRTSVMHYKKTDKTLPQIAGELGVTYIVEGSVLRAGNRVRITAQLIEANSDRHLWARSYDRDLDDVLALHSEVAGAIAQEVRVKLTPAEGNRLGGRPSVNPDAYEAYLKGRFLAGRAGAGGLSAAVERFEVSTKLDPAYAPAFSGLASALVFSANLGERPSADLMPQARAAALTSLALDPGLAEAHTARANVCMFYEYDWPCAAREFRLGADLNPGEPEVHHWYSHYLVTVGRLEDGLAEIRRARELDPLSAVFNADVSTNLALLGRFTEAEQVNREFMKVDPRSLRGVIYGEIILAKQGRFAEAAARLETLAPSERQPRTIGALGHYYGRAGRRDQALRCLEDLKSLSAERYVSPYEFARIYIGLGDKEKAFEYLDKAYEARNFGLPYFKVDPEYDPIRNDPRFQALLRKIALE